MRQFDNDLDLPTAGRGRKRHATLRAQAALLGFELIQSDPEICGQAPYYLYRYDAAKPFDDLDVVLKHLNCLSQHREAIAHNGQELQSQ